MSYSYKRKAQAVGVNPPVPITELTFFAVCVPLCWSRGVDLNHRKQKCWRIFCPNICCVAFTRLTYGAAVFSHLTTSRYLNSA